VHAARLEGVAARDEVPCPGVADRGRARRVVLRAAEQGFVAKRNDRLLAKRAGVISELLDFLLAERREALGSPRRRTARCA